MSKQEKKQNALSTTNVFSKGLVNDLDEAYLGDGMWTHARNAINRSHLGEAGVIGNEQANKLSALLPHKILAVVHKNDSEWVVFSGEGCDSEIGIYNEFDNSYNTISTDCCFDFKKEDLINAVVKKNKDCSYSVYWQDGVRPDRFLNLSDVPYTKKDQTYSTDGDCLTFEFNKQVDCSKTLLQPTIEIPHIVLSHSESSGQLQNGSYQAVIAYTVEGVKISDYFGLSNSQAMWSHSGIGGALEVHIENFDSEFLEYELVVLSQVSGQAVARHVGYYSTLHSKVTITNINQANAVIPLDTIPLSNPIYYKSDKMFSINGYLLRSGLTTRPDFNYQPLANNITSRWHAVEYPANYYRKGSNTGYMRDEVYTFFIRWIYSNGTRTASYHIPGRKPLATDTQVSFGKDVIGERTKTWQVYNTADITSLNKKTVSDGGVIVGSGIMGYHESSNRYDNLRPDIWGDLCGKPMRHHRFPDNATTHIHAKDGNVINVLAVSFSDIQHPINIDGEPIDDIVGYEILRGSREGNKSIVAKGLFNNMWEYDIEGEDDIKGMYQNFPFNDLRPNKLLRTELKKEGGHNPDNNGKAPKSYRKDMFSFHSPDTTFNRPFMSEDSVRLYTEEYGEVKGKFEIPYKHPRQKLISDTSFILSALVGIGIALQAAIGKTHASGYIEFKAKAGFLGNGVEATKATDVKRASGVGSALSDLVASIIHTPAYTLAGLASSLPAVMYYGALGVNEALEMMYTFTGFKHYGLQYNAHGFYNKSKKLLKGNRNRDIVESGAKYIDPFVQDFSKDERINNLFRNKYVAVKLSDSFANPSVKDTSRIRMRDAKGSNYKEPSDKTFTSNTSAFYGALKINYPDQYGQLDNIFQIPINSGVKKTEPSLRKRYETDVLFGGDIYINRYTEKNPYLFFNTWLMGERDGIEYNYKNYINGPAPRYWANFERFDLADFKLKISLRKGIKMTTPSDFHHLDRGKKSSNLFMLKNSFFYLSCNGVRDFFTESEINLAHRDYGEKHEERFYDHENYTDLSMLFRSDKITSGDYYKYDNSLSASKIVSNFVSWGSLLPKTFDPYVSATCYQYYPKRTVYSLQHHQENQQDSFKHYLSNNYKDFAYVVNQIKPLNETGALILFENGEPAYFSGTDTIQTTGMTKFTVGDGGLFSNTLQGIVNADDTLEYGSCQSVRGAVNTPYGMFYISQKAGKIFMFNGKTLVDISNLGQRFWFLDNLPSRLLRSFPKYPYSDNTTGGVGCQVIYDPLYELVYFCKKDYKVINDNLKLDDVGFYDIQILEGEETRIHVALGDPKYFEDCSWTRSFSPAEKYWLSSHDWHPDLVIPSYAGFLTVKDNGIWKHNSRTDLYCNFYEKDYPFEVGFSANTGIGVSTLKSVEYILENYQYSLNGKDGFMILDNNFDRAVIYNNEQMSGWLKLNITPKNNPLASLIYPKLNTNSIDILFSKEENKYRFNQFWDITRDRGEFSSNNTPMWNSKANGYERLINPSYVNYSKPATERKKFRNINNEVLLRKNISGDVKMLLKAFSMKQTPSYR